MRHSTRFYRWMYLRFQLAPISKTVCVEKEIKAFYLNFNGYTCVLNVTEYWVIAPHYVLAEIEDLSEVVPAAFN